MIDLNNLLGLNQPKPHERVFSKSEYLHVEWESLNKQGNGNTHNLKKAADSIKIEFKSKSLIFLIFIIAVGMAGIFFSFYSITELFPKYLILVFGILTIYGSISYIFRYSKKNYFDTVNKCYHNKSQYDSAIRFDQINYIQLAYKRLHGRSKYSKRNGTSMSYFVYELNLVLTDNRRINVINHDSKDKIRNYAEILEKAINIPILDGIDDDFVDKVRKFG